MTEDAPWWSRLRWRAGAAAGVVLGVVLVANEQATLPILIAGLALTLASLADSLRAGIARQRLLVVFGLVGAVLGFLGVLSSDSVLLSVGLLAVVVYSSSLTLLFNPAWTWVLYIATIWLIGIMNTPGNDPPRAITVGSLFFVGVSLYLLGTRLAPDRSTPSSPPAPVRPEVVHRFALVRTATIVLASLLGWLLAPIHPFWPAAAAHYVIRPTWKQQPQATFWRVVGTAGGTATALLIALLWPDTTALAVSLWIAGTALFVLGHLHGGLMMFLVTLFLISLLGVAGADVGLVGPRRLLTDTMGLTLGVIGDALIRAWIPGDASEASPSQAS